MNDTTTTKTALETAHRIAEIGRMIRDAEGKFAVARQQHKTEMVELQQERAALEEDILSGQSRLEF